MWTFEQWQNKVVGHETKLISEGAAILRAHDQNVQSVVKGAARPCWIAKTQSKADGEHWEVDWIVNARGLAANCPTHLTSDVGHELAKQSGSYGLLWSINKDGKCLCSLRSVGDYDVSAIAKTFGGGGHRNAAGFEIDIQTLLEWIK